MKNTDKELIEKLNNRKNNVRSIPVKINVKQDKDEQTECYGECHDCGCDCEFNETPEFIDTKDTRKSADKNGRVYKAGVFEDFLNSLDDNNKKFVGELKHKNKCNDKELIDKLNKKILTDSYFDNKKKDFEKVLSNTKNHNTDINQLSSAIEKSKEVNKRVEELFNSSKKEVITTDELIECVRQEMKKFFTEKENEKKNNWDVEAKKVWQYIYCSLFNIKDYMELISIENVTYDKLQELFDKWFDLFYTKRDNIKKQ